MRLFAAIVPPDGVREHLDEFLAPRREAAGFRWTLPEQWHLTLAFMPAVEDRRLDDLVERLTRAGRRRTPFGLRVVAGGAFPNPGRARVLWAGLAGDEHADTELERLATGARAAATKAGAGAEGGRFKAHLTLARLGRPAEVSSWVRLLDGYVGPPWTVDEFTLIASHLGEGPRKRPRYEPVDSFTLGA